jgi:hypothetical protein
MFPLLPLIGLIGGISAGAQIASGVVRAVGKLGRGQPGGAFIEVVDGLVAPVRTAGRHLAELGADAIDVVLGTEAPAPEPPPIAKTRRHRDRGTVQSTPTSLNGDLS